VPETYWKSVRLDGTDFHSGTVQWATPGAGRTLPRTVKHPTAKRVGADASGYLSVSTVPTDCTGMEWPCRLLTVEPVEGHEVTIPNPDTMPRKRASVAWRVTGEADAHAALGPQAAQVAALIARTATLTEDEARRLRTAWDAVLYAARCAALYAAWPASRAAAWDTTQEATWRAARGAAWDTTQEATWRAAWDASRDASRDAAWRASRDASWFAAWDASWYAACALVARDLISTEHYDTLTTPWRTVIGPIHPDDPSLA